VSDSIPDDVIRRLKIGKPGPANWFSVLPADTQEQLESIRARYEGGELIVRKRTLARAIIERCRERGIPTAGVQGVEDWLCRRNR